MNGLISTARNASDNEKKVELALPNPLGFFQAGEPGSLFKTCREKKKTQHSHRYQSHRKYDEGQGGTPLGK